MATLEDALAVAASAHLVAGSVFVDVHQDLDGECAASIRIGTAPPGPLRRFASLADLIAYLASGAIPGVQGNEQSWAAGGEGAVGRGDG